MIITQETTRPCSRLAAGLWLALLLASYSVPAQTDQAQKPSTAKKADLTEAEKAWLEVLKATQPPNPPAEWQAKDPSKEEIAKYQKSLGELAGTAADKAKDFYTRFPDHAQAVEAKEKHHFMLQTAVQLGNTNRLAQLQALEKSMLSDPAMKEEDRFELRSKSIQTAALSRQPEGVPAVMAEFEKGVRELQKEFPKKPETYQMLLMIASNSETEKTRALVQEIVAGNASDEIKESAKSLLKKLDIVGKPLSLKFKAVDSREVDLEKLRGKVVLVDFWATWCGPCVAELPNVKAAYEKLHDQGFEIVGISFDKEKQKLEEFIAQKKISWPQFFDGQGWENKFGREYGITSIPAMWLVDKKGILRDVNAREELADKVAKFLAE